MFDFSAEEQAAIIDYVSRYEPVVLGRAIAAVRRDNVARTTFTDELMEEVIYAAAAEARRRPNADIIKVCKVPAVKRYREFHKEKDMLVPNIKMSLDWYDANVCTVIAGVDACMKKEAKGR